MIITSCNKVHKISCYILQPIIEICVSKFFFMKHLIVELVNNMKVPQAKQDTIRLNFFLA